MRSSTEVERLGHEIDALTRERDNFGLQKRRFEEQLRGEGPNPVDPEDDEQRAMLEEMTLPEDMQRVRMAESKVDPESNRYHIKISSLR